jgi:hypothetical protein
MYIIKKANLLTRGFIVDKTKLAEKQWKKGDWDHKD